MNLLGHHRSFFQMGYLLFMSSSIADLYRVFPKAGLKWGKKGFCDSGRPQ